MFTLNDAFCADDFLAQYWQKRPLVIRQGLVDFDDPIDEHDLAGLAQEEDVDSRIVSQHADGSWTVDHGPFSDYEPVCQGKWTLLVQAVDRYSEEIDALMAPFSFIPYWRMDDVMVSFATEGAGVGAHTDQYDVFLIQGKGSRRWRVGQPDNYQLQLPHKDLKQVGAFDAIIDVELQPGDILYIPPGWPHEGVTLRDSLTYSVGFRAPDQHDLLESITEQLTQDCKTAVRYTDPNLTQSSHPGQVSNTELATLKAMIIARLEQDDCDTALLAMLSDQHLPQPEPEEIFTADSLSDALLDGTPLLRVPGCKPIFAESQTGEHFTFYVNGEAFKSPIASKSLLLPLLAGEPFYHDTDRLDFDLLQLLSTLINKGYWELGM